MGISKEECESFLKGQKINDIPEDEIKKIYLAVGKAYTDMTPRTITGHGTVDNLKDDTVKSVSELFKKYLYTNKQAPRSEKEFWTIWKNMCDSFLSEYNRKLLEAGLAMQKFGKAQKIINMTFKYLYCMLPEKRDFFTYCHMPLDSYTLEWYYHIQGKGKKKHSWSDLNEDQYEEIYKDIQDYISPCKMDGKLPSALEVEFAIWENEKRIAIIKDINRLLKLCKDDLDLRGALCRALGFADLNCTDIKQIKNLSHMDQEALIKWIRDNHDKECVIC